MADIGASILAKLKNKSKALGVPYQQCLQLFVQEEFLRRLSKSEYAGKFILKGGLLIFALTGFESRATVDVDFLLQKMNSDLPYVDEVIRAIINVPTGYNDVVILTASKAEKISLQRMYPGVSAQMMGRIKNVRIPFDVDMGIGDVVVPNPVVRHIATQLDGYDSPEVLAYSLESTIAEKFDAILQRFELTGRMKDFFDIHYLSLSFDFSGCYLQEAIFKTLVTRMTRYEQSSFDRVIALANEADMQIKWRYFLRSMKGREIPLADVLAGIDVFLRPVWDAIIGGTTCQGTWRSSTMRWE